MKVVGSNSCRSLFSIIIICYHFIWVQQSSWTLTTYIPADNRLIYCRWESRTCKACRRGGALHMPFSREDSSGSRRTPAKGALGHPNCDWRSTCYWCLCVAEALCFYPNTHKAWGFQGAVYAHLKEASGCGCYLSAHVFPAYQTSLPICPPQWASLPWVWCYWQCSSWLWPRRRQGWQWPSCIWLC
jgi:hypothetical protein